MINIPAILKRIRLSKNERWMLAIVALATLARFLLISFNWPTTNSDEGIMGLLSLHVAFQGDHPTFYYGQNYMAPLEGYLAAPLFRVFGASLFTLRLSLLPMFAAFLICMYYLTRMLYTEHFALAIVMLLSLGSGAILLLQLKAIGGYPEIELFSALIPLLAMWLALTSYQLRDEVPKSKRKRIMIYGFFGLIVGLALWDDLLILPIIATTLLLLLLVCLRELLSWKGLCLLLGIIVGTFPLILYNLSAPWNQNSLNTLLSIQQEGAKAMLAQHLTWLHHLVGTIMISLPNVSGANPACPLTSFPLYGSPTLATLPCLAFKGIWGTGYCILLIIATYCAVRGIWRHRHVFFSQHDPFDMRQALIVECGRLVILLSVILTLASYLSSTKSALPPVISYRYLLFALIALPAIVWPLWNGVRSRHSSSNNKTKLSLGVRRGLLLLIFLTFASGTLRTFAEIPASQHAYQQEGALVQNLLKIGATRLYSDYWTCNRLMFRSREHVICSVLDDQLNPGFDRYLPYRAIVRAETHPTYVFPSGSSVVDILKRQLQSSGIRYRTFTFEGYMAFQVI